MLQTITTAAGDLVIMAGNGALVSSKSVAGGWHKVAGGRCDCQGFSYRGRCRHLTAVASLTQQDQAAIEIRRAIALEYASDLYE